MGRHTGARDLNPSRWLLIAFVLAASATQPVVALEIPYLSGRINDYADLLSDTAEQRMESTLSDLERETGAQVAVLTILSLEGEPLEDFSIRVAETWKLGREGVDDGVLLLIARNDRKMRIEVGYGLEPTLTDLASKRIISEIMAPRFRTGDFDAGVESAVDVIAGTIRGQEDLIPPEPSPLQRRQAPSGGEIYVLFLIFLTVLLPATQHVYSISGKRGWLYYTFLMPFYFVLGAVGLGLIAGLVAMGAFAVIYAVLKLVGFKPSRVVSGRSSRRRGGTYIGWSGGGWSSGSGGGGFGGFSGGGGSFGGGGASGSW